MRWRTALAILLLVPALAHAAHAPDHRYMVVGRILDETARPAGFVAVQVELDGTPDRILAQIEETNCFGDFLAVLSVGELGDAALVRTTLFGHEEETPADRDFRRTFVKLSIEGTHAPEDCRDHRRNFTERHVVTGRLIEAGAPVEGEDVNVTVELAAGGVLTRGSRTNAAGDFAVGFQSPRFGDGDAAAVRARGDEWRVDLDHDFGITVADHAWPAEGGGSRTFAILAGVLALGAAAFVLYLFWTRKR